MNLLEIMKFLGSFEYWKDSMNMKFKYVLTGKIYSVREIIEDIEKCGMFSKINDLFYVHGQIGVCELHDLINLSRPVFVHVEEKPIDPKDELDTIELCMETVRIESIEQFKKMAKVDSKWIIKELEAVDNLTNRRILKENECKLMSYDEDKELYTFSFINTAKKNRKMRTEVQIGTYEYIKSEINVKGEMEVYHFDHTFFCSDCDDYQDLGIEKSLMFTIIKIKEQ